jgi:hypothetical protein
VFEGGEALNESFGVLKGLFGILKGAEIFLGGKDGKFMGLVHLL